MHLFHFCTYLTVILVFLLIKQHQALPSDLAAKLRQALDNPENAALFNEINESPESDFIDPVIQLYTFDDHDGYEKITPLLLSTTQKTTTTTLETATTDDSTGDGDKQRQDPHRSGTVKTALLGFLGTIMRIRNLFHLHQ